MANLETECSTLLNAENYASNLQVYLGQVNNEKIPVTVSEVWQYDVEQRKYT